MTPPSVDAVLDAAAEVFGVSRDQLGVEGGRRSEVVDARSAAVHFLREIEPELSQARIAEILGYTDHTPVAYLIKAFDERIRRRFLFGDKCKRMRKLLAKQGIGR